MEMNEAAFEEAVRRHIKFSLGKAYDDATIRDFYWAVSLAAMDLMVEGMLETRLRHRNADVKRLYYLSAEFLMGRALNNNLCNLGLYEVFQNSIRKMGLDPDGIESCEFDAALGNGGLGRLAACFLDSLATLNMPGYGYGINYQYGLFRQEIVDGYQKEKPDTWLAYGTPWELGRYGKACPVPIYGHVENHAGKDGADNPMWFGWQLIIGVPYDMPIVGYGGETVNYLRLFSARASREFDMKIFNDGDYFRAVEQKISSETISKVLYPSDSKAEGRELRLIQEYFLVSCAIRDIVRRYEMGHNSFELFPEKVAIQLNDTHPALAVAELMRVLVDEESLPWERSWEITTATMAYTNHTLLPEALEKWPVGLLERVLPRHLQIIYEINRRFLDRVATLYPGDIDRLRRTSIIEEGDDKQIRMAHLATIGSHSINGVSALHSELVKTMLFPDFFQMWPQRFNNKTNGITPRRWLLLVNPGLSELVTEYIGDEWVKDIDRLREIEPLSTDASFRERFLAVKRANKERLVELIKEEVGTTINPDSLFDVQAKRIHEYKRQLLKVLHIIHEYLRLVEDQKVPTVPRTYIFAGKAAPGYWAAKMIIKLICNVAEVINEDPRAKGLMKVAFIPDYRVSLAELIIPATDLSEQISTAGMEASGTGNMKFALNGALTIGTLDGANIEIREEVGQENIFIFGLRNEEVEALRASNSYNPREIYQSNPDVKRILDAINSDVFSIDEPGLFRWVFHNLLDCNDRYFHLADFVSYLSAQQSASETFLNKDEWARKAILNVARMGRFSSDRTIREYAKDIWGIKPLQ
ncbi:MAG: glycogen/starch/alpha-glucan phosphorylase [Candidatus Coatesbacteria bacterium]|nr:glycogen/starch/alpha-glucan phosphorylase [Candidatus Coatesbacteria bacterium]